jgi:hypothetical protein
MLYIYEIILLDSIYNGNFGGEAPEIFVIDEAFPILIKLKP